MVEYGQVMPQEMLEHLRSQCTVRTLDIVKLESALNNPWEAEGHIIECLSKMTLKRQKLQRAGINISDEQMAIKIVKQMFMCRHFEKVDLTAWERKPAAQKILVISKAFFSIQQKVQRENGTAKGDCNWGTSTRRTICQR